MGVKMQRKPYEFKAFRITRAYFAVDGYPISINPTKGGYFVRQEFSPNCIFVLNMAKAIDYAKQLIRIMDEDIYECDVTNEPPFHFRKRNP